MHIALNAHSLRRCSQPEDLRIKSNRNINVIAARQKQERISLRAKLTVLLRRVNGVDLLLHLRLRRLRAKHGNIRAKVRRLRIQTRSSKQENSDHSDSCGKRHRSLSPIQDVKVNAESSYRGIATHSKTHIFTAHRSAGKNGCARKEDTKMPSISRRDFVRMSAAVAAASSVIGPVADPMTAKLAAAEVKSPLGLQLYSVRALLPKDFDGTLAKLSAAGYKNVEAAGYYNKTAAEWRKAMDAAGLRCTSTHHPLPLLRQHEDEFIEFAHTAGLDYIICSSPMRRPDPANPAPPHYGDKMSLDDWHWAIDEFNRIGAKVKAAGLQFGYHNHVEVFVTVDGKLVYDELLSRTDPKLVIFEMDCGWVNAAGHDPVAYLSKTPERFPLLHVKDMVKDASGNSHSVVLGKGYIDYHPILHAAKGLKQYFIEQEEFTSNTPEVILDELHQDADYMKSFRL